MNTSASSWRWITLIVILINVAFNLLVDFILPGGGSIREVALSYPTLVTPKPYAFSIWGVIYIAFIVYGIYQVRPATYNNLLLNWLTLPTITLNVLCSVWIVFFRYNYIFISVVVILAIFQSTLNAYLKMQPGTLRIPFSLMLAWMSVALIGNISIAFYPLGWSGEPLHPNVWAIALLIITGILAALMSVYRYDATYALVIAWADTAIYVARVDGPVATTALVIACVSVIMAGYAIYRGTGKNASIESRNELRPRSGT